MRCPANFPVSLPPCPPYLLLCQLQSQITAAGLHAAHLYCARPQHISHHTSRCFCHRWARIVSHHTSRRFCHRGGHALFLITCQGVSVREVGMHCFSSHVKVFLSGRWARVVSHHTSRCSVTGVGTRCFSSHVKVFCHRGGPALLLITRQGVSVIGGHALFLSLCRAI